MLKIDMLYFKYVTKIITNLRVSQAEKPKSFSKGRQRQKQVKLFNKDQNLILLHKLTELADSISYNI